MMYLLSVSAMCRRLVIALIKLSIWNHNRQTRGQIPLKEKVLIAFSIELHCLVPILSSLSNFETYWDIIESIWRQRYVSILKYDAIRSFYSLLCNLSFCVLTTASREDLQHFKQHTYSSSVISYKKCCHEALSWLLLRWNDWRWGISS